MVGVLTAGLFKGREERQQDEVSHCLEFVRVTQQNAGASILVQVVVEAAMVQDG